MAPDRRRRSKNLNPWLLVSGAVGVLALAPILALAYTATRGSVNPWTHLIAYVLLPATRDTLILLAGVGLLTACIGTGTAWLVTAYEFPGRRTFDWALLLPLAVPTYVMAYAYLDVLHPVGWVQTAIREILGYDSPRQFRLPDVRSMIGCIFVLGFVLYPFVYLTTRAMFLMQTANVFDVARTLGVGRRAMFFRVALPLARPAVAVGVSLALMDVLNDIGASEFLGVRTLTVSIYSIRTTRAGLPAAAQISIAMLLVVLGVVMFERWARRRQRYTNDDQNPRPLERQRLRGPAAALAFAVAAIPVFVGFGVPATYLVHETVARIRFAGISPVLAKEAADTVSFSLVATIVTLVAGVAVAYAVRLGSGPLPGAIARLASLGYAIPGIVLALGLLPVITGVDMLLDGVADSVLGVSTGLLLLGSGAGLVYAYFVRFLTIAAGGVEAGLSRVPPSLDHAAQTLGETAGGRLRRIHIPLTRPALAMAAMLVFVGCMKELPATLMLRPLGVDTLATHLYGEAIRGTYEEAAIAALLIVLVGLVPVLLLARIGRTRDVNRWV